MSLRNLSDHEILSRLQELTRKERALTLNVLLHLIEIERRRLHLKQAYKSMFDYCTTGLGYSASAASRRIRTARCVARFPEVYELLERNEVNLSTVSQVAAILTPDNKNEILPRICGKSQKDVEAIVAESEPRSALPRDRVRSVLLQTHVPTGVCAGSGATATRDPLGEASATTTPGSRSASEHNRSGREVPTARAGGPVRPELGNEKRLERHHVIQFSTSVSFMSKVEQARALVWHRIPANASFEQVFELALDLLIARESAAARQMRRAERLKNTPRVNSKASAKRRERRGRIPNSVRDHVFMRDEGRCTFTQGHKRCASTTALQIDHIKPLALGGPNTADNLRLLCAYHNRLEAERTLTAGGIVRFGKPT
jgi:5-methylcytosine-specific restriction endonuclease McrA